MNGVLYRKYRPASFSQVVEQEHVKTTLQNQLKFNQVAHAYLFIGPRGVGKTTLARVLARAVNCLNLGTDGEPCNTCTACQALLNNACVDVIEMDAAGNIKPSKNPAKSTGRIDGISALVTALARAIVQPPETKSLYFERGIRSLGDFLR